MSVHFPSSGTVEDWIAGCNRRLVLCMCECDPPWQQMLPEAGLIVALLGSPSDSHCFVRTLPVSSGSWSQYSSNMFKFEKCVMTGHQGLHSVLVNRMLCHIRDLHPPSREWTMMVSPRNVRE